MLILPVVPFANGAVTNTRLVSSSLTAFPST
jgi:hypothetical protein